MNEEIQRALAQAWARGFTSGESFANWGSDNTRNPYLAEIERLTTVADEVKEALGHLDGTDLAAISLITGLSSEEISDLGGVA